MASSRVLSFLRGNRVMRGLLPSLFCALLASVPVAAAEPFRWHPAFQPFQETSPSAGAAAKIVVSVMTNDDPYRLEGDAASPWCDAMLKREVATLLERRPDLSDQLHFQLLPAGRPAIVTGGASRNQPARVIIAFCDEAYRLLDLSVGVPDADDLQASMEDVQEARLLRENKGTNRAAFQEQIAARAAERLPRRWRPAMEAALKSARQISLPAPPSPEEPPARLGPLMSSERALAELAPVYQQDVRFRFGLTEQEDWVRLGILEQHPETRRDWSEAVLPALVDLDWEALWRPTALSIWQYPPFRPQPLDSEMLTWFDRQIANGMVALIVGEKPLHSYDSLLQLVSNDARKTADQRWNALREHVEALPHRSVSLEQLVALLHARELSSIDLEQPSPARYLIFEAGEPVPLIIRTTDSPSKWLRRLKRKDAARP